MACPWAVSSEPAVLISSRIALFAVSEFLLTFKSDERTCLQCLQSLQDQHKPYDLACYR